MSRSQAATECLGISSFLLALALVSCTGAASQSDRVVARHQKEFYEAWLRRELHDNELREVTDEFIALYTKQGKDRAGIHQAAESFDLYTKLLREHDGTPGALTTRHLLLVANYFDPNMQHTTELRLLTEPDPVRVVDPGYKQLMTEKDVIALGNLNNFAKSEGDPHQMEFSRQQIDRGAMEMDRLFGNHPKAVRMPRYFHETAALWAGIQQQWPLLNANQKRQVRAYAGKGYMAPIDDYMLYGKLLGLNAQGAFDHWLNDSTMARLKLAEMEAFLSAIQNVMLR